MPGKIYSLAACFILSLFLITCDSAQKRKNTTAERVRSKKYYSRKTPYNKRDYKNNRPVTIKTASSRAPVDHQKSVSPGYRPTIKYQESILEKFRKKETDDLIRYIGMTYKRNRHYAVKVLGERDADSDKAVISLAVLLADRDLKVKISAFDALSEIDEKELAEAVSGSYNSTDPETRFAGIKDIKDKRLAEIYLKTFGKSVSNAAPVEALNFMISESGFDMSSDEKKKIADEIIDISARSFSRASEKTQNEIAKLIIMSGEDSVEKVIKKYNYKPDQIMKLTAVLYETDRHKTEDAIMNSISSFRISYNRDPVKFISGFAGNSLACRITDYILNNGRMDTRTAIGFLAEWPVEKSRDKLKEIISKRGRYAEYAVEAAGRTGDKSFTPYILDYIRHIPVYKKAKPVIALGYLMDKRAVKPLCEILKNEKDYRLKNESVRALGYIGDASALPFLIKYATDRKTASLEVVKALKMMPSRAAAEYLNRVILEGRANSFYRYNKTTVRDAAILCGPKIVPYMKRILANRKSREDQITDAITILGSAGKMNDGKVIMPYLGNKDYNIQTSAATALGRLGYISAVSAILDNSKKSERSAKNALVMMGKPAIPYLKKFASDKKYKNREPAIEALNDIYNAYACYKSGNIYLKMKDYKSALRDFSKAVRTKPDFHRARINSGVCNYHLKYYSAALDDFKKVAVYSSEYRAEAYMNIGAVYQKADSSAHRNFEKDHCSMLARFYTQKALTLKSGSASVNYNMAWLLDENFSLDAARHNNEKAIKINPSHVKAVILKASIQAKDGKLSEAESLLESAGKRTDKQELIKIVEKDKKILKGESI